MSVIRLGYVHLRVTDLEEARNHYSNTLGMEVVHEEPGKLLPQVLGRVGPPLPGARGGRRRAGQARLQGRDRRRPRRVREARPAVRRDHRPVQRGGEPDRRRRRAHHPALRAHPRAVHRHGVHRHRHRVDQPRGVAAEHARGRHALDRPRPDRRGGPRPGRAVLAWRCWTSGPPSGWSRAWSTRR